MNAKIRYSIAILISHSGHQHLILPFTSRSQGLPVTEIRQINNRKRLTKSLSFTNPSFLSEEPENLAVGTTGTAPLIFLLGEL